MKTGKLLAAGVLTFALSAGLSQATLPVAPMDDAAKAAAEAKKAKAAEAAKEAAVALAKAQDRAVANYKKNHDMSSKPAAAKTKK
jgi:hypothetical protein